MIKFKRHSSRKLAPDITPLLDVIFILLIFFVVSAVFTSKGMDLDLPKAETCKPVSGKSIEIKLSNSGKIFYESNAVSLRDLAFKLKDLSELKESAKPKQILFKSSPDATVKDFIEVIDMVRSRGFNNLVIATTGKEKDLAHEK